MEDKEPDVALSRFDELSADSVYKSRAEPALADVKTLFLAAHLDLADSARTQGRCDEATAEIEKVQQIDPANRQARDIIRKCKVRPVGRACPRRRVPPPSPRHDRSAAADPREAPLAPRPVTLPHPIPQPGAPAAAVAKAAPARPAARTATIRPPAAAATGTGGPPSPATPPGRAPAAAKKQPRLSISLTSSAGARSLDAPAVWVGH